jgi:ribonuclease G
MTRERLLQIAASGERGSEHPLGEAIVRGAEKENLEFLKVDHFEAIPGHGIEVAIEGMNTLIGNRKLMDERNISLGELDGQSDRLAGEGKTPMYIAVDSNISGIIAVADVVKESSAKAIKKLQSMGIEVAMITGDNRKTAEAIAKQVGINRVLAEVLPQDKSNEVKKLQAEGKKVAELDQELKRLVSKFENSVVKLEKMTAPTLVLRELDRTIAMIRDLYNPDFANIYVNDSEIAAEIKEYVGTIDPEKKKVVKLYNGKVPMWEHFGIDKQIKASFGKTVSFRSGAYLIIEHTEAFHVIDVNSGNRSKTGDQESNAMEVNLAAAEEIARQLRLRDMGGIIVIDFIDMHGNENRQKVFEKMKEAMASDRTKHNILPLSKFCLMQITRQRVRQEMAIETAEICPVCKGSGKVTPTLLFIEEIEQKVRYIFEDLHKKSLTIQLHPFIGAYVTRGWFSKAFRWKWKYHRGVKIEEVNSMSFLDSKFFDENKEEIIF